jgi:uncharacterized membrane protein
LYPIFIAELFFLVVIVFVVIFFFILEVKSSKYNGNHKKKTIKMYIKRDKDTEYKKDEKNMLKFCSFLERFSSVILP